MGHGAPSLLHRVLLRLYPRDFRRQVGEQILAFWTTQRLETRYGTPGIGALRYWFDVARDAMGNGLRLRRDPRRAQALGLELLDGGLSPAPLERLSFPGALDLFLQDVRFARRSLLRQPLFTSVAVITLAVGIGATTAVFSIVDTVLYRPLPYTQPDELVLLGRADGDQLDGLALPEVEGLAELQVFASTAPAVSYGTDIQWSEYAEVMNGASVGHQFTDVLGIEPILGRGFAPDEDLPGAAPVVMITERLWREHFAASPDAIGDVMSIENVSHTVVGVVRNDLDFPEAGVEFWTTFRDAALIRRLDLNPDQRGLTFFGSVARLRDGASVASAQAEVDALFERLQAEEPVNDMVPRGLVQSMHEATVGGSRTGLLLFLGAVALVFVIACANVAGLWLSRVSGRGAEMALRTALGAGRRRIVTQLLTESLLLAGAGCAAGIGLAMALQRGILAIVPTSIPRVDAAGLDGRVLLFAAALATLAALAFGVAPALRATGRDRSDVLRESSRSVAAASTNAQRMLVVGQIAIAVVLLAGAGLFANSYSRLLQVDPGARSAGVVLATFSPTLEGDNTDAIRGFYAGLLPRLDAVPGVAGTAMTYSPIMGTSNFRQSIQHETMPEDDNLWAGNVIVSPNYFEISGVSLLRGRGFTEEDTLATPHVVIVNEVLAEEMWPGEDALGKRFRWARGMSGSMDSFEREFFPRDYMTVVSVAGNVRRRGLDQEPIAEFYRPHAQMSWPSMTVVLATEGNNPNLAEDIRAAAADIDPMVPMSAVRSLEEGVQASVAEPRFRVLLVGGFALVACALSMLGIYAVMALTVNRQTHSIGIRMALGAEGSAVRRQVVVDGMRLAAVGVTLGLGGALWLSRTVAAMLYQVEPTDPPTFVGVALLTLLVAGAACYVPARRASRLDPVAALRTD